MEGVNLGRIGKDRKTAKNQNAIHKVKNIDVSNLLHEFLLNNHEGFKKIMNLHQMLKPDWVKAYNEQERRKPKNIQTFISEKVTAQDIIDDAGEDEITKLALSTVVSNRIAHYVTNLIKNEVADYQKNNNIKLDKNSFAEVVKSLRIYFDPENKDNGKKLSLSQYVLNKRRHRFK